MATLIINYIVPRTYVALEKKTGDCTVLRMPEDRGEGKDPIMLEVTPGVKIVVSNNYGIPGRTYYWYLKNKEKQTILKEGVNAKACIFTVPETASGKEVLDIDVFDYMYDRRWCFYGDWEIKKTDFLFD